MSLTRPKSEKKRCGQEQRHRVKFLPFSPNKDKTGKQQETAEQIDRDNQNHGFSLLVFFSPISADIGMMLPFHENLSGIFAEIR